METTVVVIDRENCSLEDALQVDIVVIGVVVDGVVVDGVVDVEIEG